MANERVRELLSSLLKENQEAVSELETKEVLRAWGLPVPLCFLASNPAEAVKVAKKIGYPVVLKVHSPAIVHKSDFGGVKLDLRDETAVERAYSEIKRACSPLDPDFKVLVQPMAEAGVEVMLGVSEDPQFGPAVMFGLGGILVELFQDVSFRLLPVSRSEAAELIRSIQAFPLLKGYRGRPATDIDNLTGLVVSVSEMVNSYPVISELDLNPIILSSQGAAIVDARMVLRKQQEHSLR